MEPTFNLRLVWRQHQPSWSTGIQWTERLQQEFVNPTTNEREWRDVPTADVEEQAAGATD
jgi:hypothetical protein